MSNPGESRPPFRAEQVGSLLRPDALIQARQQHESGDISATELNEAEDRAIADVCKLQEELGLHSITDGEFRQRSWFHDFVLSLEGTEIRLGDFAVDFNSDSGHRRPTPTPYVHGKVRRHGPITVDRYSYLDSVTSETAKITMPSPTLVHFFSGRNGVDREIYPYLDELFDDLAAAYREEIAALAAAGCRYVQLDEVPLALLCDPNIREAVNANGEDPEQLPATYVKLINAALRDRPDSIAVGMHLCRGNNRGHWLGSGGYEPIAELVFGQVDVDAFFLEFDSPRAGDFGPLRHLATDKSLVLGLVSTKTPELESKDDLKQRIEEAAQLVDLERLSISPQCGFASNFLGNPITLDDEKKKLALVVETASETWGHA